MVAMFFAPAKAKPPPVTWRRRLNSKFQSDKFNANQVRLNLEITRKTPGKTRLSSQLGVQFLY
jgi:hypothetical protein